MESYHAHQRIFPAEKRLPFFTLYATGASVYSLVLEKDWLSKEELDDLLMPEKMTPPR